MERLLDRSSWWMAWTTPTAMFFSAILLMLADDDGLGAGLADDRAARLPADDDDSRRPAVHRPAGRRLDPSSAGWCSRGLPLWWGVDHRADLVRCGDALRLRPAPRRTLAGQTLPPGRSVAAGDGCTWRGRQGDGVMTKWHVGSRDVPGVDRRPSRRGFAMPGRHPGQRRRTRRSTSGSTSSSPRRCRATRRSRS